MKIYVASRSEPRAAGVPIVASWTLRSERSAQDPEWDRVSLSKPVPGRFQPLIGYSRPNRGRLPNCHLRV